MSLTCLLQNRERCAAALNHFARHHKLFDLLVGRQHVHHVEHQLFEYHPESARSNLALACQTGNRSQRIFGEAELHAFVLEQLLILLHQRVLWRGQYLYHRRFIKLVKRSADRKPPDELRNQPELDQILRLDLRKSLAEPLLARALDVGIETQSFLAGAFLDHFFEPDKRASTNKEDVSCVDGEELLMRMLAPALRRNVRDSAFEDFQQCLLNALAGHITGDRRVLVFTADLVDLVDVDNSGLSPLNVAVGRLKQFQNDVLDVFTNIAGFGECGRVHNRKRHVKHASQRLRKKRLAGTGRAYEQYVGFLNLDFGRAALK